MYSWSSMFEQILLQNGELGNFCSFTNELIREDSADRHGLVALNEVCSYKIYRCYRLLLKFYTFYSRKLLINGEIWSI